MQRAGHVGSRAITIHELFLQSLSGDDLFLVLSLLRSGFFIRELVQIRFQQQLSGFPRSQVGSNARSPEPRAWRRFTVLEAYQCVQKFLAHDECPSVLFCEGVEILNDRRAQ